MSRSWTLAPRWSKQTFLNRKTAWIWSKLRQCDHFGIFPQYLTFYHCNPDIGILLWEVFWWITSPFARVCWLGWRSRNASEIPLEHTLRKTKRGNLKMRIFKAMLLGCHPQNQEGAAGMIGIWWLSEVRRSHRNQPSKEGWDHWSQFFPVYSEMWEPMDLAKHGSIGRVPNIMVHQAGYFPFIAPKNQRTAFDILPYQFSISKSRRPQMTDVSVSEPFGLIFFNPCLGSTHVCGNKVNFEPQPFPAGNRKPSNIQPLYDHPTPTPSSNHVTDFE